MNYNFSKRVDQALGKSAIILMHDGLEFKDDAGQENTVVALQKIISAKKYSAESAW